MAYQIKDGQTGEMRPKVYSTRRAARKVADRLDNEYGAVRYSVKETPTPKEA